MLGMIVLAVLVVGIRLGLAWQRRVGMAEEVGRKEEIKTIAWGLEIPWEIVFVSEREFLVTERPGRVRMVRDGKLEVKPLAVLENVAAEGEGGLLGMALDPSYANNGFIYVYYTYRDGKDLFNRVARFTRRGDELSDEKVIVDRIPGGKVHDGGRIKFGPDGFLYIGTGDAGRAKLAQDLNSLAGKILRVDTEDPTRSVNFYGTLVYSYGHRNVQGLAWDEARQLYATEHGPAGHDEFNFVRPWSNHGWPKVTGDNWEPSLVGPMVQSGNDTWAPSGAVYYKGSVFFGGLRGVAIYEVEIQNAKADLKVHMRDSFGRVRDVVVGPDGYFYILTSNRDGRGIISEGDDRVVRIAPRIFL